MKTVILASLLFTSLTFAHELGFSTYIEMQEGLALDDFQRALDAHKIICDKELIHYKDDYKDCLRSFKDIEELRSSFKVLSKVFIENGDKKELLQYKQASCPMVKGEWVQRMDKLANPYLGTKMADCGEWIRNEPGTR